MNSINPEQQQMKKVFVHYPMSKMNYMADPNRLTFNMPYNPLYVIPNNNYIGWSWEQQDSDFSLYDKVNKLCNLELLNKKIIYIDCTNFDVPNYTTIFGIQKVNKKNGKDLSLEECRCIFIADRIWFYTNDNYKYTKDSGSIYSFTFKYYMTEDEWNYIAFAPKSFPVLDSVAKEIKSTYRLFRVITTINTDNIGYPYLEVLITNMSRINYPGTDSKIFLSKDIHNQMSHHIDKLKLSFKHGLEVGARESILLSIKRKGVDDRNSREYYMNMLGITYDDLNVKM